MTVEVILCLPQLSQKSSKNLQVILKFLRTLLILIIYSTFSKILVDCLDDLALLYTAIETGAVRKKLYSAQKIYIWFYFKQFTLPQVAAV